MKKLRIAELAIAALVIAVVAMLIVPLPRPLLDILLTLNIAIAVCLLMAAVFTPKPLGFASFPTLLVVTTLFRVGLEVSATRLILADGDAGEVVRAFGGSVVAGSLIVGIVVFAVITIVQLVVVARGAERVAEVAARFALDAMPGKQMAIDAELRASTLDADSARARRAELERESQLYGAMDGAMRFVKGDAIAAIIIVLVNLVGGMVVGVGSRGMSAGDAMQTYSLLSIGEGLVAQIPSLLVAVASGLLVTRVASTGDRALGEDLGVQLGGQPRALVAAAILLVGLGLVPGLPLAPFLLLGGAAAIAAWIAVRNRPVVGVDLDEPGEVRGSRPVLMLGAALVKIGRPELHAMLAELRAAVTARTGVPIPAFAVTIDQSLGDHECALAIDATPVVWLDADSLDALRDKLPAALAAIAPDLLGVDRIAALVERAAITAPVLVREVVPKLVALPVLAEILRGLVREGVPIDDIAAILDAIALAPGAPHTTRDVPVLVEQLRGQLRRQISARWAPRGQLAVYTVDAMIEDAVRTAVDRRDGVPILALEPAIAQDIINAVRTRLAGDAAAVILTSGDVRRHLRSLLEPELPGVAVLAAHELAPGTNVRTAGRIEVA
ncbi:MAG: flagellar biosynthesis protein FlhA [Kofleriaceae bacterium]